MTYEYDDNTKLYATKTFENNNKFSQKCPTPVSNFYAQKERMFLV